MGDNQLNNSLKILAKTSGIILIGLFISKILSYTYRILIARHFGPETYGLFSLALMIFSLFVAFASLGLTEGVLKYISSYRGGKEIKKINYIVKYSISTLLISGIVFSILLFLFSNFISLKIFHNPGLIIFLRIFSFLIPVVIFSNLFLSILKAYEKIKWCSFIQNILQNTIKILLLIFMIFLGFKINSIIFSYFFTLLSILIISYLVCKYKLSEVFLKISITDESKKKIRKSLVCYSWPIILIGVMGSLFYWVDSFSIGYFLSVTEVGIYNAAVPIAAFFLITSEIFMQLFFPLINKEYAQDNIRLIKELSKQVGKWIFIINLPLFLIILLFPETIINILFGGNYLSAGNALRFLSLGLFFSSISAVSGQLILMKGKSKLMLFNVLIFSALNLILNLLLVPTYGINGAAFSTMLSGVLMNITFIIQANYLVSITPFRRKMLRIFIAALIPTALLIYVKQFIAIHTLSLILIGLLFLLSYVLLIFLTGCLDKNDFMILGSIKEKLFGRREDKQK